jgi:adenine C2-methylase RlmN of 23S rRNA A2503 and tRNA A37
MDIEKVRAVLDSRKEPAFRLKQVLQAVYKDAISSYAEATALPAELRAALEQGAPLLSLKRKLVKVSAEGNAHKAVLTLSDGTDIETVLLKPRPGPSWTVCISCQVGCAMGCTFCATALMGLERSLKVEEIADQVLFWKQYLRAGQAEGKLDHVVYMGMGEPFHCYDSVAKSLRMLMDPELFAIADRHISVSTVGVIAGMMRFCSDFPQVNLALSLHAAKDGLREELVPSARAFPLERLAKELGRTLDKNRRKIFLEYCLLAGENDDRDAANALVRFIRSTGRTDLLHVNLIAWNPTDTPHTVSSPEAVKEFRDFLRSRGIAVTIRKSLGTDIQGACGQLITSEKRKEKKTLGSARRKHAPKSR